MTPPPITDYIAFLSSSTSFPEPTAAVQVVQTHISVVAMTDRYVYKLKKPVKFDFLDFSTLSQRKFYCEEEIRLNRRLSPNIYQGLLPIYFDQGQIQFEKGGELIDYVVKMNRLSDEGMLINLIKDPEFPSGTMDRVAQKLLRFYKDLLGSAPINEFGKIDNIRHTITEISHGFEQIPSLGLPEDSGKILRDYLFGFLETNVSLFSERVKARKIVEGHGDLRSEHIHITHTEVNIYDCLEFDLKLRSVDWLNDIAFLLMDLDYRHCHHLALRLEKSLVIELEKADISPLLTFYKTYRACVRGKVNGLKGLETEIPDPVREESRQKARRYYQLAMRYALIGSRPTVILCMGGVASGKSTLAKAMAAFLNLTHLNSDYIRKQLAGIDPYTRLEDEERDQLYTQERMEEVYQTLFLKALDEIKKNGVVLLDATYRHRHQLQTLVEDCKQQGIQLLIIHTTASENVIRQRLQKRETEPSVSDMRLADYTAGRFAIEYRVDEVSAQVLTVNTEKPADSLLTETIVPWLIQQKTPYPTDKSIP